MKLICPNCNKVLEIEEKANNELIECDNCKMKFPLLEGMKAFERQFNYLKNKGHSEYVKCNFNKAMEYYLEALKYKNDDFESIAKYSLNLLYSQRFDNIKYHEMIEFIDSKDIELNSNNTYLYLSFIDTYLGQINLYFKESKRFIYEDSFINEKYFDYFYQGLKEIKESLDYFSNVFSLLKGEDFEHFKDTEYDILSAFNKIKNEVNSSLNRIYNLNHKGDFVVEDDKKVFSNEHIKDFEETEVSDLRLIIPNDKIMKLMKFTYLGCAILLVISLGLIIGGAISKINVLYYISIALIVVALLLGISTFFKVRKENSK